MNLVKERREKIIVSIKEEDIYLIRIHGVEYINKEYRG